MAHNVRSPEQWAIISKQVDFRNKTVLDLGCGKGDILFYAYEAGAKVTGIDKDDENIKYILDIHPEVEIIEGDIDLLIKEYPTGYYADISICFSVLPYLMFTEYALKWLNYHSNVAFIECQYAGDGPGFVFLTGNDDMREWLLAAGHFEKVQPIGHTFVEGRNKNRFIWMCE